MYMRVRQDSSMVHTIGLTAKHYTIIYQSFQQLTSSLFSQEICSLQNHCQTQTKLTSQNLFSRSTPMGSCVTVFRDAIITQWTKIENSNRKLYGGILDLFSTLYGLQMLELSMTHVFRYLNQQKITQNDQKLQNLLLLNKNHEIKF